MDTANEQNTEAEASNNEMRITSTAMGLKGEIYMGGVIVDDEQGTSGFIIKRADNDKPITQEDVTRIPGCREVRSLTLSHQDDKAVVMVSGIGHDHRGFVGVVKGITDPDYSPDTTALVHEKVKLDDAVLVAMQVDDYVDGRRVVIGSALNEAGNAFPIIDILDPQMRSEKTVAMQHRETKEPLPGQFLCLATSQEGVIFIGGGMRVDGDQIRGIIFRVDRSDGQYEITNNITFGDDNFEAVIVRQLKVDEESGLLEAVFVIAKEGKTSGLTKYLDLELNGFVMVDEAPDHEGTGMDDEVMDEPTGD